MILSDIEMEKLERAAEIIKGFGNPIRLRIIDALQGKSMME